VVTEYLIKYCELIFSDKLPPFITTPAAANNSKLSPSPSEGSAGSNSDTSATPRVTVKMRPKSLAISTPTKLLSLEEARNRALNQVNLLDAQKYIEVGGGPENLPSRYHTVIELPAGTYYQTS
jgi:hypothetical protein